MPSEALNAWRTLLSAWDAWLLTFVLVAVVRRWAISGSAGSWLAASRASQRA